MCNVFHMWLVSVPTELSSRKTKKKQTIQKPTKSLNKYLCCVRNINISPSVASQLFIFHAHPSRYLPSFATREHAQRERSDAVESCCVLAGAALWRNSEGGLFSLRLMPRRLKTFCAATDSLCLPFFVCSDTARTPGGGTGSLTSPGFHHRFPKHPWNVSSWKTPFHPESPAVPHAPTAQDLLTPSGKTEKHTSGQPPPKRFAHSARTQRRRLTLWMGSVGYHYIHLRSTSKLPRLCAAGGWR